MRTACFCGSLRGAVTGGGPRGYHPGRYGPRVVLVPGGYGSGGMVPGGTVPEGYGSREFWSWG